MGINWFVAGFCSGLMFTDIMEKRFGSALFQGSLALINVFMALHFNG